MSICYEQREIIKKEAWEILRSDAHIHIKSQAMLNIIDAHYWRAREGFDKYPKKTQRRIHGKRFLRGYQLDIDVYTRHWLWAQEMAPIDKSVRDYVIKNFYTPEQSRFMGKGKTTYSREPK